MELGLAEILVLVLIVYGVYRLLTPLQRRIEAFLLRILNRRSGDWRGKVIDVDSYSSRKRPGPEKE